MTGEPEVAVSGPETTVGPSPPAIRRGWLRALLALLAYLVATLAIGLGAAVVVAVASDGPPLEALARLGDPAEVDLGVLAALQAANLIGVVLVVALLRRLVDRRSVRSLGLAAAWRDLASGLGAGVLVIVGTVAALLAGGWVRLTAADPAIGAAALLGYLGLLVVVAFQEELLARGYLLANLMESFPAPVALTVSAVVFALLHLGNANVSLLAFVNLVLAGVVLGVYYVHRRSLWFSVGMHLTWNLVQGPILGFEVSGVATPSLVEPTFAGPAAVTGGPFGLEGSVVITALLVAAIAVIHLVYRPRPTEG